jgi:hypothetical protein
MLSETIGKVLSYHRKIINSISDAESKHEVIPVSLRH